MTPSNVSVAWCFWYELLSVTKQSKAFLLCFIKILITKRKLNCNKKTLFYKMMMIKLSELKILYKII